MDMTTEFLTWESLSSFTTCTAFVMLVTQACKSKLKIPCRVFTYVLALVTLLVAQYFLGTLTLSSGALTFFNALCISSAANKLYDAGTTGVERIKNLSAK